MKQLSLLIKRCEECPYYQRDPRVSEKLCFFREESPFAIIRIDDELIDARCGLPEWTEAVDND